MVKLSKNDHKRFCQKIKRDKKRERVGECNFYDHFKDSANIEAGVVQEGLHEVNGEDTCLYNEEVDILDRRIDFEKIEKAINGLGTNYLHGQIISLMNYS